jgi:RND superfamily putative drug exporter
MSHGDGSFFARIGQGVVRRRAVTLLAWVGIALALNLLIPQLEAVIGRASQPIIPDSAQSVQAFKKMDREFGGSGAQSVAFVVFIDDGGLTAADGQYYERVVKRLNAQDGEITAIQDVISNPAFKQALTSRDGEAIYLPVGLAGGVGSPEATRQTQLLRDITSGPDKPDDLQTYVTGTAATITDLQTEANRSVEMITLVTVAGIGAILLLIYRSIVTAGIALATIGVALLVSRAATAYLGLHVFDVSTFTSAFLTAIVLGAGTDYSVFLISRYHEERRNGAEPLAAVRTATRKVGAVITASAATVIAASLSMGLAEIGIFRTSGPALAVSIAVTLLTALTLAPALLAMAGARGRAEAPRTSFTGGMWEKAGLLVTRRPVAVLLIGLLVLGALAAFYPGMRRSFDERAVQPASTESNRGYDALAEHFHPNEVLPDYVLVTSDHDLRNSRDLAALEQMAQAVEKVEGVRTVRGVTRPQGKPISQASIGYQNGQVGRKLRTAEERLAKGERPAQQLSAGADRVAGGADQLANGAGRLADGASKATAAVDRFISGLSAGYQGLGDAVDGSREARDGARKLAEGAEELAAALQLAHDQTELAVDGLGQAYTALKRDPICTADPICNRSRAGIGKIYTAQRDKLLPGLAKAAAGAQRIATGNDRLGDGLADLKAGLAEARAGVKQLNDGQRVFQGKLGELANGADKVAGGADELAGGAGKVSDGTGRLTASTRELRKGLDRAADFLLTTAKATKDPAIGGFYLPSSALGDSRMALAKGFYLSEDGHTARLVVLGGSDPFGHAAIERAAVIEQAVQTASRGGPLQGSDIIATGPAAINADLAALSNEDFTLVAIVALLAVLLILMILLRSLIAPLYLLASVLISYASAIGLGVLAWQHVLGQDVEWSVPVIAFVILVAVGADYNILLVSRIREESDDGSREGVARAVAMTGGVITSAGMIFAVSFLAMMAGSVTTLAQLGFTVGVGLLIDTLVVRGLVVPAVATMVGRWNWWPGGRRSHG